MGVVDADTNLAESLQKQEVGKAADCTLVWLGEHVDTSFDAIICMRTFCISRRPPRLSYAVLSDARRPWLLQSRFVIHGTVTMVSHQVTATRNLIMFRFAAFCCLDRANYLPAGNAYVRGREIHALV